MTSREKLNSVSGQAGSGRPPMRCKDRPRRRKLDCCGASPPPLLLPILRFPPAGVQMEGPVGQKVKREKRRKCGHDFGEKQKGGVGDTDREVCR